MTKKQLTYQQLTDLYQYIQDDLDRCEELDVEPSNNLLEIQMTLEQMIDQRN